MDEPTTQTLSIDQLERQQGLLEEEEEEHGGPARARRRSRESRGSTAAGAGNNTVITSGEVIQVDMSRLANVLGERGVARCSFGGCDKSSNRKR